MQHQETIYNNKQVHLTSNGQDFDFFAAANRLKDIVYRTPLILNYNLSKKYQANIYLKREDLQLVRSYKIRGAYN
ncbi:MAG TPA: hypothetical protein VK498_16145, partial [Ferruginibacter sp.]|nr:hypothetical protein [Ferruginibacter sp.]